MEANKLINDLSVAEKIELYNCLYEDLSGKGIDGDTELAHVNVEEMAVLRAMGGSGTINPHTNLIQFGGGGGSPPPPPPATQTVTQQATIPDELKPFVTDVLEKARAIQERREVEGYVPFAGARIAEFAPEQTQAFEQIKGLVGQGQQYFDPAARLTAASAFAPTAPQVSQFMNPYLQNVVDIQQREARRAGDIERQQLGAQAVGAGGFGGSRQAILEAEQARNLQQQLGDIQARGLAAAYEDAQARLQQQRERERLAGAQFATLGQVAPGQAFRELSALEAIGAQRQQQQQQALDIAQQEYEIARTFPERTLQDYQSIIRGYAAPIPASTVQRSQRTTPAPSFLQQAAGLGLATAGIGKAFGGFKKGGLVSLANGGPPTDSGSTQIEMLSKMSTQALNRAAGDPNFSPALVEAERRRRRDAEDEASRRSRMGIYEQKARANELTGLLTREQIYNRGLNNFPATSDENLVAKRQAALADMERGDYKTAMGLSKQPIPAESLVEKLEKEGKPTTGVPNIEAAINALGQLVPEGLKPRPYGQGVEDYGPRLQTEIKRVQKEASKLPSPFSEDLSRLGRGIKKGVKTVTDITDQPYQSFSDSIGSHLRDFGTYFTGTPEQLLRDTQQSAKMREQLGQDIRTAYKRVMGTDRDDLMGDTFIKRGLTDVPQAGPMKGQVTDQETYAEATKRVEEGSATPVELKILEEARKQDAAERRSKEYEGKGLLDDQYERTLTPREELLAKSLPDSQGRTNVMDDSPISLEETEAIGNLTPDILPDAKDVADQVNKAAKGASDLAADTNNNISGLAANVKKDIAEGNTNSANIQFMNELSDLKSRLAESYGKEREALMKQLETKDRGTGLALLELGGAILAQDGGQTFMQALGKGLKDSKFTTKISNLDDRQKKLALGIARLDRQELQSEFDLTKAQADAVIASRKLDIQSRLADTEEQKAKIVRQKDVLEFNAKYGGTIDMNKEVGLSRAKDLMTDAFKDIGGYSPEMKAAFKRKGYTEDSILPWVNNDLGAVTENKAKQQVFASTFNRFIAQTRNPNLAIKAALIDTINSLPPIGK